MHEETNICGGGKNERLAVPAEKNRTHGGGENNLSEAAASTPFPRNGVHGGVENNLSEAAVSQPFPRNGVHRGGTGAGETPGISLVIPCFNEEDAIPLLYKEAIKVLDEKEGIKNLEFIFVDDGSRDSTLCELRKYAALDSRVHYLSFSRNFGKEAALLAGLAESRGNFVVTLDADLQDPPALIPEMLAAVRGGEYDCAATRRVTRKGEPPVRSLFARVFYRLMSQVAEIEVIDGARDFRLMSRVYVDALLSLEERNRFSKGIFPWIGFRTKWFEYENIGRSAGHTKWSFWKLVVYALNGIIAFSSKPLAIASVLGILIFLASIVLISSIIIKKLAGYTVNVDGWASTVCIILFTSGIQLFSVGILGQYIAKTYTEVKRRPHYIIREAS
ncbi:MAG: glycosyltransferase family 2 protein [Spirochaetaceae bacterium]|jgi:glycosyltransferase involved in cell wall biosynthesis|nr:glycosyltransferase family 2 protein [Spirochaetaceae bacterium]